MGVPSRSLNPNEDVKYEKAVVIVGEAPGAQEDKAHRCWVGRTGRLLEQFISVAKLPDYVDVYLTNACRCRPAQDHTPTTAQIRYCRPWLFADLLILHDHYKEVIIFVQGASAARSILNCKLADAFYHQKTTVELKLTEDRTEKFPVFVTYHPSYLLGGRKPQMIESVKLHWQLLLNYLTGEETIRTKEKLDFTYNLKPPTSEGK